VPTPGKPAPCDQAVSTEFSYRIAGDGIRNSRVFSVQPQSGDRETITVDEGSKAAFVAGILGVSVGALTMSRIRQKLRDCVERKLARGPA